MSNLLEALSWSGIAVASNWQVLLGGAFLLPFRQPPSSSTLRRLTHWITLDEALAVKACASGYGPSMSASLVGFSSFSPSTPSPHRHAPRPSESVTDRAVFIALILSSAEALAAEDLIRCASAIFAPLIWVRLSLSLRLSQPSERPQADACPRHKHCTFCRDLSSRG